MEGPPAAAGGGWRPSNVGGRPACGMRPRERQDPGSDPRPGEKKKKGGSEKKRGGRKKKKGGRKKSEIKKGGGGGGGNEDRGPHPPQGTAWGPHTGPSPRPDRKAKAHGKFANINMHKQRTG